MSPARFRSGSRICPRTHAQVCARACRSADVRQTTCSSWFRTTGSSTRRAVSDSGQAGPGLTGPASTGHRTRLPVKRSGSGTWIHEYESRRLASAARTCSASGNAARSPGSVSRSVAHPVPQPQRRQSFGVQCSFPSRCASWNQSFGIPGLPWQRSHAYTASASDSRTRSVPSSSGMSSCFFTGS